MVEQAVEEDVMREAEQRLKLVLGRGTARQITSTHHVGDAALCIIYYDDEVIGDDAIGPAHDGIAEVLGGRLGHVEAAAIDKLYPRIGKPHTNRFGALAPSPIGQDSVATGVAVGKTAVGRAAPFFPALLARALAGIKEPLAR